MEDIIQKDGRDIGREREEEIVESFMFFRKPGGHFRQIRYTQKFPGPESHRKRVYKCTSTLEKRKREILCVKTV